MRNVFYYKIPAYCSLSTVVTVNFDSLYISGVGSWWKTFYNELVVLRLTDGRLELLIVSVYLFWILVCVTHISLQHSWKVGGIMSNQNYIHSDTQTKENALLLFLDVTFLKFLDQKSLLQLFLDCETSVLFLTLPFSSNKRQYFYCHTDGLAVLHWRLLLYREKGQTYGLKKIESYCTQNCIWIHHVWPP
jgi:hypothetical protein